MGIGGVMIMIMIMMSMMMITMSMMMMMIHKLGGWGKNENAKSNKPKTKRSQCLPCATVKKRKERKKLLYNALHKLPQPSLTPHCLPSSQRTPSFDVFASERAML